MHGEGEVAGARVKGGGGIAAEVVIAVESSGADGADGGV